MPQRTSPPFRADHVGSLLRPAALKDIEDSEIINVIKKQEEIGLQLATDGEFRRSWWHFDFFDGLDGVEVYEADQGIQFKGIQTKAQSVRITGKMGFPADHPFIEHFKFVKQHTKVTPKMTIPSPSVLHFRGGRKAIDKQTYPEMDAFFDDLGTMYGQAIKSFYNAGCRYLQLDDTVWAYLCSK